jgi:hypothetical protein
MRTHIERCVEDPRDTLLCVYACVYAFVCITDVCTLCVLMNGVCPCAAAAERLWRVRRLPLADLLFGKGY